MFLTDKAKKELPIIEGYENEVLDNIIKNIDSKDADKFVKILEVIRKNISEI